MALTEKLTSIADAIRAKSGKTEGLTLSQMPAEIAAIRTGAELNFEVVSNPQPANPKENTVWVDTDSISDWAFSAAEPENPVAGMVWFSTGTSSPAAFNALTEGNITVYPVSAKQYVGGVWVDKTAKSYQGSAWAELWDGTLYDAGNEYEFITGGWTSGNVSSSSTATPSAITKNDDRIVIPNRQSASNGAFTVNAIDLTNYTKLKAIYSGNTPSLRVAPNYPASSATASAKGSNVGETRTELTLDISGLTGMYRPALSCSTQYAISLYKMWLE